MNINIYLLDPKSEVFQSFLDVNQLYGFLNRCTRTCKGKILIVSNMNIARKRVLSDESPAEIHALCLRYINEIR